jgi:hypothetical protein
MSNISKGRILMPKVKALDLHVLLAASDPVPRLNNTIAIDRFS